MNTLPPITFVTIEIIGFIDALTQHQDEHNICILNGVDEVYGTQKRSILMMSPLPLVEPLLDFFRARRISKRVVRSSKRRNKHPSHVQ